MTVTNLPEPDWYS